MKILAFDIDNTLAPINKPIPSHIIDELRKFEEEGFKIAFISGKPAIYISGFVRQVGLEQSIIIGENGLSIYYGCELPPKISLEEEVTVEMIKKLQVIKKHIFNRFGEAVWFQPNAISVTAFPQAEEIMDELVSFVDKFFEDTSIDDYLINYKHSDSIDIAPKHVNKGKALTRLLIHEQLSSSDLIAIGDGENDIPMFQVAGLSIGVNFKGHYKPIENFNSIEEAIRFIKTV